MLRKKVGKLAKARAGSIKMVVLTISPPMISQRSHTNRMALLSALQRRSQPSTSTNLDKVTTQVTPPETSAKFTKSYAILPNSVFPKPVSPKPSNHRSQKLRSAQANSNTTHQSITNRSFQILKGLEHPLLQKRIRAEGIRSRETLSRCCRPWVDSKITM